jgi:UDP-3-O-[3-hydroxymyristoyl] glucosamine N-acyltransferase
MGIVFDKEYFEKIEVKQLLELKKSDVWLATVANFSSAMCTFSKFFHDLDRKELNLILDGRISGSAQVDPFSDIAQNVFIGENVIIGKGTAILPGAVVHSNSQIGENCLINSNVVIYAKTIIGNAVTINSNTTIGGDGFGYNFLNGVHEKIWHFAGVIIGNNVDIGSNSAVDQGAFSPTTIGNGTKIDNFCQVGHNSRVGNHVIICGRAGTSGSVQVDDYVAFGAGAGAGPGAHLGKGSQLAACCIVGENSIIAPGEIMAGHPAMPLKKWLKAHAKLRNL